MLDYILSNMSIVWVVLMVVFLVVEAATAGLTRSQPTNADMMIGKEALVTEDIDNVEATGAVSVGGKVWTARSADGGRIKSGAVVSVLRIEGVKLIVEPVPAQSQA
jgi:membrane protein implicated in regulation of membrane protease activity